MRESVIFVYAVGENSHLNSDAVHQSLTGYTVDDRREFRAKTFTTMRCGS